MLVRRGIQVIAATLGLTGGAMLVATGWLMDLGDAVVVKLFGLLTTILSIVITALLSLIMYHVKQSLATLQAIPGMRTSMDRLEVRVESVDQRTLHIPRTQEWFDGVARDIRILRKLCVRMRDQGKQLRDRIGWCEGKLDKQHCEPGQGC